MNLNLFDALKNEIESNKSIQKFIKELGEAIDNVKNRELSQNEQELEQYRKEGHLYLVTEDRDGKVFLWDLTDKPKNEIEEIDFPNELIDKATEGSVFKYTNGTYEFYSEDGYEILFNE